MQIQVKRIYEAPSVQDGQRILVDRLWPRGLSKKMAKLHSWAKHVAPTDELRRWYQHDPNKWPEFKRRYFAELDANAIAVRNLVASFEEPVVTLLFSSKEPRLNNAVALKQYLEADS
jgi:uncharacterized protein YeaO (DUF488 family)